MTQQQASAPRIAYVEVTEADGTPIPNLKSQDFSALEKGYPVEIVSVSSASSVPLLIGVTIDSSGSVGRDLQRGKELEVLYRYLPTALTSSDKAFVTAFNDEPLHLTAITGNISELRNGIQKLANSAPRGSTALYDALIDAIGVMASDRASRKLIVCVGDFEDNVSRHTLEKTLESIRSSGVAVFPLLEYDSYQHSRHPRETERGIKVARQIASESGGFVSTFESPAQLQTALEKLQQILRTSYMLQYKSAAELANKKAPPQPKITLVGRNNITVLVTVPAYQ